MPVYERRCNDCAHRFEAFSSMAESDRIRCPICTGTTSNIITTIRVSTGELHGQAQHLREIKVHPTEVREANRIFGSTGVTFDPKGRAIAPDSRAARRFFEREHTLKRQAQERRDANTQMTQ